MLINCEGDPYAGVASVTSSLNGAFKLESFKMTWVELVVIIRLDD